MKPANVIPFAVFAKARRAFAKTYAKSKTGGEPARKAGFAGPDQSGFQAAHR